MPDIQGLLEQAKQSETTWLCPVGASLTRPDGRLLRSLNGHTDSVNAIAITPDDKQVISGSSDKTLKVWNLKTGEIERSLAGHFDSVNAIAITPDSKWVISGSSDKTLIVWNQETGRKERTLIGHTDSVNTIAITPDSKWVISGSSDKTLIVWNLETGKIERTFKCPIDLVAVAITSDGKWVISNSGKYIDERKYLPRAVSASDTDILRRNLIIWNLATGKKQILKVENLKIKNRRVFIERSNLVKAVAVTPNGKRVIYSSSDKTLKVWNLETGEELFALTGHTDSVNAVALNSNGKWVISGSSDKTLKIWKLTDAAVTDYGINDDKGIRKQARELLVTTLSNEVFYPFNLASISPVEYSIYRFLDFSNDNSGNDTYADAIATTLNQMISLFNNGKLNLVNPKTFEIFYLGAFFDYYEDFLSLLKAEISPLSSFSRFILVFSICIVALYFCIIACVYYLPIPTVWNLYLSILLGLLMGGTVVATAINIFNIVMQKLIRKCHVTVAVTPNGKQVISGSFWGTIRVWDIETRKKLFSLTGHTNSVNTVAITPDSKRMISGSSDTSLKVWNLKTKRELFKLEGHEDSINAVAVTPNGKWLISGSSDTTLRVWNLETRENLLTFKGHSASINAVAVLPNVRWGIYKYFSVKGKRSKCLTEKYWVVSGSSDNTLKIWGLFSGKVIASFTGDSAILCCAVAPTEMFAKKLEIALGWYEKLSELKELQIASKPEELINEKFTHLMQLGNTQLQNWDAPLTYKELIVVGEASGRLHFLRLEQT